MSAHDEILEKLQQARARGLGELSGRLGRIVEGLDDSIRQARAAIDAAIDPDDPESFGGTDVEHAIRSLGERAQRSDERVHELEERLAAADGGSAAGGGLDLELLRGLDVARSQSELLRELLPRLAEHVARAVVLVIRSGRISAWSGIGFSDGESLRSWDADPADSTVLTDFVDRARPVAFEPADDAVFSQWLAGETRPDEALLIPVCLRGKMMGGIYLDRLVDRPWDPGVAQALIALTCWMIDTLHHRQVVPTPMLAEIHDIRPQGDQTEDLGATPPTAPPPRAPATGDTEPDFDPSATMRVDAERLKAEPAREVPASDEAVEVDVEDEPQASVSVDVETPRAEAVPDDEPDTGSTFESVPVEAESGELTPVEPGEPAQSFESTPPAPAAVTPPEPPPPDALPAPPPVRPVQPPPPKPETVTSSSGMSPEDEARHEEARRFARLLVSEIKLYNEDEVDRGRANGDLYHRLNEDIDRSREMYEKRIPPEVRTARDYFRDELVRILADGDADALGM